MPHPKETRCLRMGVLGCGPISQIAHFEAICKARNVELHAICDAAADLRERMALLHRPSAVYADFEAMLGDAQVEAVLIGVADQFHVPLAQQALRAGKHVFVEKPLGVDVESCDGLVREVQVAQRVLQVGNNRRFDPGVMFARRFVAEELGGLLSLKAWYWDSHVRYTMTDNLQAVVERSAQARRPAGDPKADRRRYFLLTHGSHLVDTARWFAGDIVAVHARHQERFGAHAWFVEIEFANGTLGHLDLTVPVQGDFEEGFHIQGERGSVKARGHLPWFHKAADVECYSTWARVYQRPLGEDAFTYKLQLESFADAILHGKPQVGATAEDGAAVVRTLAAIARSAELNQWVRVADVTGAV